MWPNNIFSCLEYQWLACGAVTSYQFQELRPREVSSEGFQELGPGDGISNGASTLCGIRVGTLVGSAKATMFGLVGNVQKATRPRAIGTRLESVRFRRSAWNQVYSVDVQIAPSRVAFCTFRTSPRMVTFEDPTRVPTLIPVELSPTSFLYS